MLTIHISPSFYVRHQPLIKREAARGGWGEGWPVAVGQVADNAMLEKGRRNVSSFFVLDKWQFDNDVNRNLPPKWARRWSWRSRRGQEVV
jgi:hypothetical protein